jgi:branched-chain amino acid transport system substrate-binding protein
MSKAWFWAVAACLALASPSAFAQEGITRDSILIGRSAGMTGAIAARMKPATEAITAYFDAVNAAGGVGGRQLKLINLDDGNDPKRAAENVRRLVTQD